MSRADVTTTIRSTPKKLASYKVSQIFNHSRLHRERNRATKTAGMDWKTTRFFYVFMIVTSGAVRGLQITSTGPTSIEMASSGTVKLDCQFKLDPQDSGPLDIEWSLQPSDNQKEEKVCQCSTGLHSWRSARGLELITFTLILIARLCAPLHIHRFSTPSPHELPASVHQIRVRPSPPKCSIEGSTYVGDNVVMKCKSSEGTTPIQYIWDRVTGNKLLPATAVVDSVAGTISMRNASEAMSGSYRCTAKNRVGTNECVLQLSVTQPPNTAGIIAGTVIGVLLLLLLLALLLFCCCRARHKKKYEKEISYEIREDVPPPKSRISTARSFTSAGSQRSSLGSMSPSNLHEYTKAQYDKIPTEEYDRPPSHAPLPPPSRMAGPNLSRMGAVPVMVPAQNRDGSIV
ncbi:coxsackievirus and adenovirus receptor homolog [Brachyhypopomus gauderio]|uniref:coxsackievirus and adenovirus receptor homolog n=1 Tax=Brachyhypopomus gauderio TaxID=698409 RepID=UPI004041FD9A